MNPYPTNLKLLDEKQLQIEWSDGQNRIYSFFEVRSSCPCATCREKRNQDEQKPAMLPVLSAEEAQPLKITGMKPVGNYAYSIEFSDGHDTGIFSFDLLRVLGEESA